MRLSRLPGPSSALGQHLLGLASVLLVVGVVVLWLTGARATQQADRHADQLVRSTALTLALPLTGEDIAGDVTWQARLDDAVAPLIADDEIVTAHVWDRIDDTMGELIWSSSPDRIGDVVPLGGAAEALDTGEAVTERLADGHQSEGPMLPDLYEAYLPFHDRTGTAYVLEIYKPVREYDEIRGDLLRDWLPIALLGIVAVGAITLPLSLRLARAAARAERDRTAFADRALRARAEEHRRIAEVLHERTVQDLSAAHRGINQWAAHLPKASTCPAGGWWGLLCPRSVCRRSTRSTSSCASACSFCLAPVTTTPICFPVCRKWCKRRAV